MDREPPIANAAARLLLCRTAECLCALPIAHVVEVLRPLPIEPLFGMPQSVLGLCIIRGAPVPVIDAGMLLSGCASPPGRLVTLKAGTRIMALAVEEVVGVRVLDAAALSLLPPLLRDAAGDAVEAIRACDGELLLLLDAAQVIPPPLFDELEARGAWA